MYFVEKMKKKNITIQVDISAYLLIGGPGIFVRGMYDILPYKTKNCNFIPSKVIYPSKEKKNSNLYFIPFPRFNESIYNKWINIKKVNKLILSPCFVPTNWRHFPNKNIWKEKKFSEILKQVKGIAIHSERVRNHLSQRSNTINMLNKYKIIHPYTNLKPKYIKAFVKRDIDILFFEKYKDLDRIQQGAQIFNLFNNASKKIERLKYGSYTKEKMEYLANNTKFIIYFSFFETCEIGLKEIQNYRVFTFSHQRDLIIHNDTGFMFLN